SDTEINQMLTKRRKDRQKQMEFETELEVAKAKMLLEAGVFTLQETESAGIGSSKVSATKSMTGQPPAEGAGSDATDVPKPKIDNRLKHSENSSKQPGKNSDPRK